MACDQEPPRKGFSGLVDLASDMDEIEIILSAVPLVESATTATTQAPSPRAVDQSSSPKPTSTLPNQPVASVGKRHYFSGEALSRIAAGLCILVILGLFALYQKPNTNPQKQQSLPPATSTSRSNSTPSAPPANLSPTVKPPQQKPPHISPPGKVDLSEVTPDKLSYQEPPIGTNNILLIPQIRWCLREKLRIETIRPILNTNAGIDKFNKIVDNYNLCCASFRYIGGTFEQAKRDVEKDHTQIASEALQDAKKMDQLR